MNIIVTGGSGFIGRHLVRRLVEQENNVINIDTVIGRRDWEWLPFFTSPVDFIFHLASPVGCRKVMLEQGVYSNIIRGAAAAIECADRLGAKLVAFSSAEAEYGSSLSDKRYEYPRGKKMLEYLCAHSPCDVAVIRPHNVIGPGQNPDAGFVVPRFIKAKHQGKPLKIFGTGQQQRVFTSVHDVVDFCMLLLKGFKGKELYKIGNPANAATINELAYMIGRDVGVEYVSGAESYGIDNYEDMPSRNWVDISEATKLGWLPTRSLPDIIKEIENEYRNDRAQPATADKAVY